MAWDPNFANVTQIIVKNWTKIKEIRREGRIKNGKKYFKFIKRSAKGWFGCLHCSDIWMLNVNSIYKHIRFKHLNESVVPREKILSKSTED